MFAFMEDSVRFAMDLTRRLQAEYREAPGLKLTVAQGARFWGLDPATCERALQKLEKAGFLSRCEDGSYRLLDS
jgi:DNA-binding IclR family transcriptional regulator